MFEADARRWAENYRVAQEVERQEFAFSGDANREQHIAAALQLAALVADLHGWPPQSDRLAEQEERLARDRWARLRQRLLQR